MPQAAPRPKALISFFPADTRSGSLSANKALSVAALATEVQPAPATAAPERGLTVLALAGSTAPYIGLVWLGVTTLRSGRERFYLKMYHVVA